MWPAPSDCVRSRRPPAPARPNARIGGSDARQQGEVDARGRAGCPRWLAVPSLAVAETLAQQQFDWLCIDMQHALIDYRDAVDMIRVIAEHDVVPVVRVPSNEAGVIGRMLCRRARGAW